MSHQSNVMQAYVTRFEPEPIKEDKPEETTTPEEPTSDSSSSEE